MNVPTIIWFVLLFIFDIYIIFWYRKKRYLKDKFEEMKTTITKLGHTLSVNGHKGSGKTTTTAGIILVLTEGLYKLAEERMNDIRISLPFFNFNFLEENFCENYLLLEGEEYAEEQAIDVTLSLLDKEMFNYFYTDFLSINDKKEMLRDYLKYYWVVNFRGVELYSSGYMFNFISGKLGKQLDPTGNYLRKVKYTENYQGGFFTIKFNDEKSIDSGNEKSMDKDLRESGIRDYLALKRHEGKGTCFDISPAQVATDVNSQERRQNDVNLEIYDRNDSIGDFKITRKVLSLILKIAFLPIAGGLKIKAFFKRIPYDELKLEFSKKCGFYRKFEAFIDRFSKLLKRQGYIRIRCRAYYRADDVGKKDPTLYDRYVFYFPIYYCYGVVDTYEYAPIMEHYSKMNAKSVDAEISQFDHEKRIKLFNQIISK